MRLMALISIITTKQLQNTYIKQGKTINDRNTKKNI